MHVLAFASLYFPVGQVTHFEAPAPEYVPAAQDVQFDDLTPLYCPAGQFPHSPVPALPANLPAAQSKHAALPLPVHPVSPLVLFPAGQLVHELKLYIYLPALQVLYGLRKDMCRAREGTIHAAPLSVVHRGRNNAQRDNEK